MSGQSGVISSQNVKQIIGAVLLCRAMSAEVVVTMADKAAKTAETAVQERATIQKELDDLKNIVGVLSGQAAILTGRPPRPRWRPGSTSLPRLSASPSRQLAGVR